MPTPFSAVKACKAAIISAFTAEQVEGGKLSNVLSIGTTWLPEAGVFPYVGVDLVEKTETLKGNCYEVGCRWGITLSVKGERNGTLAAVSQVRDDLIDDGTGNGVEPILRGIIVNLLGGLIHQAKITQTVPTVNLDTDSTASPSVFTAEAVITFWTYQTVCQ